MSRTSVESWNTEWEVSASHSLLDLTTITLSKASIAQGCDGFADEDEDVTGIFVLATIVVPFKKSLKEDMLGW